MTSRPQARRRRPRQDAERSTAERGSLIARDAHKRFSPLLTQSIGPIRGTKVPSVRGRRSLRNAEAQCDIGRASIEGLAARGDTLVALHARVLIVAKDDRSAGALAEGLDRLGWRTVTARDAEAGARAPWATCEIEAAIVDLAGAGETPGPLAETLRAACRPRRLPVSPWPRPRRRRRARLRPGPRRRRCIPPRLALAARTTGAHRRRGGGVRAARRHLRRAQRPARPARSDRRHAAPRAGHRLARAAVPGAHQRPGRDRPGRASAPSPPTPPSTICTSAASTPSCSGPARTRPRRSRSPRACAATPASITSPPCSICAGPRPRLRRGVQPRHHRRRLAGDAETRDRPARRRARPAPIAARPPSARRWRTRAAQA